MASRSFTFLKFPRVLLDAPFNRLSSDAKLLYTLLLDRLSYSEKNGLADESGQEYVIYTINQVCDALGCKRDKAMRLLRRLEAIGLISRQKLGRNRPDRIYVHTDILDHAPAKASKKQRQEHTSTHSWKSQNATSGGRKISAQEVAKYDPNKTRTNKTISIKNQSITQAEIDGYREQIKKQIGYDLLLLDYSSAELDSVVETMAEAYTSSFPCISFGKKIYSRSSIADRYAQLTSEQIAYVVQSIKQQQRQGTVIRNLKAYLQAALINAPASFGMYMAPPTYA